jgi:hypothetical protein
MREAVLNQIELDLERAEDEQADKVLKKAISYYKAFGKDMGDEVAYNLADLFDMTTDITDIFYDSKVNSYVRLAGRIPIMQEAIATISQFMQVYYLSEFDSYQDNEFTRLSQEQCTAYSIYKNLLHAKSILNYETYSIMALNDLVEEGQVFLDAAIRGFRSFLYSGFSESDKLETANFYLAKALIDKGSYEDAFLPLGALLNDEIVEMKIEEDAWNMLKHILEKVPQSEGSFEYNNTKLQSIGEGALQLSDPTEKLDALLLVVKGYETMLKLFPEDVLVQHRLGSWYGTLGVVLTNQGKWADATVNLAKSIEHLTGVIEGYDKEDEEFIYGQNPSYLGFIAWTYYNRAQSVMSLDKTLKEMGEIAVPSASKLASLAISDMEKAMEMPFSQTMLTVNCLWFLGNWHSETDPNLAVSYLNQFVLSMMDGHGGVKTQENASKIAEAGEVIEGLNFFNNRPEYFKLHKN